MTFRFDVIEIQATQKVMLAGRLDSATSSYFEKDLLNLFNMPGCSVLMDFSALNYISSAGLRIILMAAKKAKQVNGRLMLCDLQPNVRSVFEVSGFLTIVEVVENQEAAFSLIGNQC